jgi:hypothetical protein
VASAEKPLSCQSLQTPLTFGSTQSGSLSCPNGGSVVTSFFSDTTCSTLTSALQYQLGQCNGANRASNYRCTGGSSGPPSSALQALGSATLGNNCQSAPGELLLLKNGACFPWHLVQSHHMYRNKFCHQGIVPVND